MNSTKYALICGINYIGTDTPLNGCINDAVKMREILIKYYNYNPQNITLLTDLTKIKPTKKNILEQLQKLINNAKKGSKLLFHYSGHGSSLYDQNNDEIDHKDECLVPLDYKKNGMIRDDNIKKIIEKLSKDSQLIMITDACHSGTMMDLRYRWDCWGNSSKTLVNIEKNEKKVAENFEVNSSKNTYTQSKNDYWNDLIISSSIDEHYCDDDSCGTIIAISGCKDSETSADAYINRKFQGALSYSLFEILASNDHKNIPMDNLLKKLHYVLNSQNYTQKPVIQMNKNLPFDTALFTL